MSISVSYELYKGRKGNWVLDSAFDDRAQAVYVASSLAEQLKGTDIKLIEERFDQDSGSSREKVIFSKKAERDAPVLVRNDTMRPMTSNADDKRKLAENTEVIVRMESNTKSRIKKKTAKEKAAREKNLKWMKSFNSLFVPLASMVWIGLIFFVLVLNWESIIAFIF